MDDEQVNTDAHDGLATTEHPHTAAEKVANTLRELSDPGEDADELRLTLATVCMAMEQRMGPELAKHQESGELDEFVLGLTRFLALHRSDTLRRLVVVELPRRELKPDQMLLALRHALEEAESAGSPF
jgi:hypothetical protein